MTHTSTSRVLPSAGTILGLGRASTWAFLDPRSQDLFGEWEVVARDCVAALRVEAGRNPCDRRLSDLVGELSTRSDEFRTWWATHNVKIHTTVATPSDPQRLVCKLSTIAKALDLPSP